MESDSREQQTCEDLKQTQNRPYTANSYCRVRQYAAIMRESGGFKGKNARGMRESNEKARPSGSQRSFAAWPPRAFTS
jgi:hypothetical protein